VTEAEESVSVHVVSYETRNAIGAIVECIDSIYCDASNAEARAALINRRPRQFPGMVADVEEYRLMDVVISQDREIRRVHKLDWDRVRQIRSRAKAGESLRSIARSYDVSAQTVTKIVHQIIWKTPG
jgi:DNA invertase Pin-like site-specific DNA recombinase